MKVSIATIVVIMIIGSICSSVEAFHSDTTTVAVTAGTKLVIHGKGGHDGNYCSELKIDYSPTLEDDDDYQIKVKGYINDEHVKTCKDDHKCNVELVSHHWHNKFKYEVKVTKDGFVTYEEIPDMCDYAQFMQLVLILIVCGIPLGCILLCISPFLCCWFIACIITACDDTKEHNFTNDDEDVVEVTLHPTKDGKVPTDDGSPPGEPLTKSDKTSHNNGAEELAKLV